jgi:hypothetical protein
VDLSGQAPCGHSSWFRRPSSPTCSRSAAAFGERRQEITVAFTATAVLLLAAGGILSLLWFNRLL